MTKLLCWAGFALALSMALAACGKVENCKVGTEGCKDGPPSKSGECKFGLVKSADGTKCIEPGSGDGDSMGDGDMTKDAGMPDAGPPVCTCADPNELCVVEGQCVNYCVVPDHLPGSLAKTAQDPRPKMPVFCKAPDDQPDLTFEEVCKNRCLIQCERFAWFCGGDLTACQTACDDPTVQTTCATDIATCTGGDASKNLKCVTQACDAVRSSGCNDTTCADTSKKIDCSTVVCTNNCNANDDGFCDDGDTFYTKPDPTAGDATDSNLCKWGSDCGDCGPRTGMNTSSNLPLGAQCQYNQACAGNVQIIVDNGKVTDLARTETWCVEIVEVAVGNFRCVPDASGKTEQCPTGFKTVTLIGADTNGDGKGDPITQVVGKDTLTAKVCVPAMCN